MRDLAYFAMHRVRGMYQLGTKVSTKCLVAKANTKYRYRRVKVSNGSQRDTSLHGCFGTRGQYQPRGLQCDQLRQC